MDVKYQNACPIERRQHRRTHRAIGTHHGIQRIREGGYFEFIREPNGKINHRLFKPYK